jgi:hypothetical protein
MRRAATFVLLSLTACTLREQALIPSTSPQALHARNLTAAPLVYVSDPLDNAVEVYREGGHDQAPIATVRAGVSRPAGLAVDDAGNLYVANTAGDSVTEYRRGGSSPVATYSKDVLGPVDVAIDDEGTVYVANFYSFAHAVVEFPSGSRTPSLTVSAPCGCYPIGLTLDAQHNLYVAYNNFFAQTVIYEYTPGSSNGTFINLQLGAARWEAAGVIFDSAANLLVANATLPGIQVFPPGELNPKKVFGKRGAPRFLQLDAPEKHLFVTDTVHNGVEEYSYPAIKLTNVLRTGLESVYGVAVSPRAPL